MSLRAKSYRVRQTKFYNDYRGFQVLTHPTNLLLYTSCKSPFHKFIGRAEDPIPQEKISVLWDGHLARPSYFCKRFYVLTALFFIIFGIVKRVKTLTLR